MVISLQYFVEEKPVELAKILAMCRDSNIRYTIKIIFILFVFSDIFTQKYVGQFHKILTNNLCGIHFLP
jgi:hypothetical protein